VLANLQEREFDIQFESHSAAILERDFPTALEDLEHVDLG
jgi:hypothetical protein